jgi:hypothetical protein
VWVPAPYEGALWTPGYWNFYGGHYLWHQGYWGRHVGFYGGVDYGFGYGGTGYYGGYWNGSHFYYNTAVSRVNGNANHYVYSHAAPRPAYGGYTRTAYAGGPHGVPARPQPAEIAAMHEHHTPALASQVQFRQQAQQNHAQAFNTNHGRPQDVVANHALAAQHVAPPARGQVARPAGGRPNGNNNGFRPNSDNGQAMRNAQEQERTQQQNMNNMRMQQQPGAAPQNQARPPQNNVRGRITPQGQTPNQMHPQGANRPAVQPHNFQQPENHAAPQRPAPESRPAPVTRQQPQARPEAMRPQPQARPAPAMRPQPQARPEAMRPQPQARPAPAMRAPHPAPAMHAPAPHPAPAAHEEHR